MLTVSFKREDCAEHTFSEEQPPNAIGGASFHLLLQISHGGDAFRSASQQKSAALGPN
jgi:hypothetical protein